MKAVFCEKYGPPEVLTIREAEKPVPGRKEVLIRVRATSVNAADCNVRGLTYIPKGLGFLARMMLGRKGPKVRIPGTVLAGEVEAAGAEVKSFRPGDRVFGTGPEMGAYAEYACRPENGALAPMPENMSFEEAATVPYGALTALYFLRDRAGVGPGQKVLVIGASGGVGVWAVQLARHFGAEVTGVCSGPNAEFVRSLGADRVIDYREEDVARSGEKWDVIFDVVVGNTSYSRHRRLLNPKGFYLAVAGGLPDMLAMVRTSVTGGRKVVFGGGTASEKKENLVYLKELIEKGVLKSSPDRTFPLDRIVEAHRYVESGAKKGNVAVTLD